MITRVTVVEMSAGVAAFYTLFSSILTSPIRTHRTPPGNIKSKWPIKYWMYYWYFRLCGCGESEHIVAGTEIQFCSSVFWQTFLLQTFLQTLFGTFIHFCLITWLHLKWSINNVYLHLWQDWDQCMWNASYGVGWYNRTRPLQVFRSS